MEQRSDLDKAARKTRAGNGKTKKGASGDGLHGVARAKKAPAASVARAAPAVEQGGIDRRTLLLSLTALKKGDFSVRLPPDLEGLDGKIADTFNDVVELNDRMARELQRLSRVVGKEGKLSQRAFIGEVNGAWAEEIACMNALIGDLVHPTAETARVIGAVAKGDLSQTMALEVDGRPLDGEFFRTAKTVNTMVEQLGTFASEVTRVAREVGTEGKLGGQADVKGVAGTWKDLTDSVNSMAGNITAQVRNIAAVTTAVARGDLTQKITVDVRGEILELKDTFNTMVDQLRSFASEVTRVAREVGTEGKLGGQAEVKGVAGTWKDLTDSVNSMASNLTVQLRDVSKVATAIANGDLTQKITVDVRGEILQIKDVINTTVDQLSSFAAEVTRVARDVGTEGKLGGQAEVKGVAGTWKDLTDSVNSMASNLTAQVRNIAAVTTAVARGDLTQKITVDVRGEILELKNTFNTMVDQLRSFAAQVTRVAREVGTEGKLGGQAEVTGVAGTWKDLTDSVNSMASNLTAQVRNIADVTTAVANGDLSKKITVDVRGEILELKDTFNTMVDQLRSFASEVTRVAREVGTEGKLGGQASVPGVAGTWKDLTDSVNSMASNLTAQVRNIADVTTAVARGDLSKKITVDVKGEILELKNTFNTMVDQLSSFAAEVTRVAREVGTEGKLGGQAEVKGVAGTWKDLTDSVNSMASNLTAQVRNIAAVTTAVANGDLSKKITVDVRGEILELKDTFNTMVDQLRSFASEVTRVAREVGTEGKLGGQASVPGVAGTWKDLTDSVNSMASNLTAQVRNIAAVTTAVANGDLSKKITVDVRGEILELKNTINYTMVDQLNAFASEVTRVAREVGTEGKLGGQASVPGVAGTWKDLTDNVNFMAGNLTNQVRGIAKVVTAVANGDLKRKLVVDAKGEIAALADTINGVIETLATFADQVTTVAREVGVEGKLGGQASVPGAAGTWKDLTDNVNRLAANLTTQVRAIAEVATAVTKGDLTRSIKVEAQGEVAALKDTINEMIRNLKDTTLKNSEQDWLKTNLAKFSRMLQGQKDLLTVGRLILSELAPVVTAQQGVFYIMDASRDESVLKLLASYAYKVRKNIDNHFKLGEGLVGQCALEKEKILLVNAPPDYIRITSGLGEAPPVNIIVIPVLFEGQVKAVIELASFERFSPTHQAFLDQLTESIGIVLNTIEANMRTEDLLKQSQSLARELQSQQEELQETNAALGEKARLLAEQNVEVERKNHEVEQARQALEEKARQLALTSKYKSEFMANMSHELRTPLNSLLILSDQLSRNNDQNLTPRQVEFAKTIHASGTDLLALINDILDLSKIESGTVVVDVGEISFKDLSDYVQRTFRHVAEAKKLEFELAFAQELPPSMLTDAKRLQQVLKNLLSNAFKFTERGRVILEVTVAREGWSRENDVLSRADAVIALSVHDTGIGIAPDKQQIIFEAFQQADGSTSRKYGGTGLGLAISREIARLLGGDLVLVSAPGRGSTFTLYLPRSYRPVRAARRQPAHILDAPAINEEPVHSSRPSDRLSTVVDAQIVDDSENVRPGDRALLIVENDTVFARFLVDVAREHNFKAIVAVRGATALSLVRELRPLAITLDINLPDIDGWRVLDCLKRDLQARHIPVQVITTETEEERCRARRMGAVGLLNKPLSSRTALDDAFGRLDGLVNSPQRRLLLIEPDRAAGDPVAELLQDEGVAITSVETGQAALAALQHEGFDALVLGLRLPDMSGLELIDHLDRAGRFAELTAIVYTPADIAGDDEVQVARLAQRLPVKHVQSRERLYDEVTLALHRRLSDLPEPKRLIVEQLHEPTAALSGKCALIVDDDFRNIYALKTVLESHGMTTLAADTGKAAIERLERTSGIDVVLMDIMMPEMDGYDTMRAIRKRPVFQTLPIIAVTARAMKGDREKCLEAGATDYISKPVDTEQLLALLRIWLHR
ncbi:MULTISPECIES: HAMP domain-containing protein [Sorangium]|uniref:HAMP domain-containing protein n=1 Tax=Sorangium TaxID=39643 RepID=UPI003D9C0D4D